MGILWQYFINKYIVFTYHIPVPDLLARPRAPRADVHFVVSLHDLIGFLAMRPGIVVSARVELTITARRDSFIEPASLIAFQHPLNSTFGAASAAVGT